MHKIFVFGLSESVLPSQVLQQLTLCRHIFATPRMQTLLNGHSGHLHNISPLQKAVDTMHTLLPSSNIAVLASGDPLFFGIGKRLINEFGQQRLFFSPALSSIQRAAALFRVPWDDATILSLHGRNCSHIPGRILQQGKSFLFTDKTHSPDRISRQIKDYLQHIEEHDRLAAIRVSVAENIGTEDERIYKGSLTETAEQRFSPLNVMLVENIRPSNIAYRLGLSEEDIQHSRGLITKNEIRAATLHHLRLPETGVFWDIGAGSGSISIESARLNPNLTLYAIEHRPEEILNIKENVRRYGCYNIIPVHGLAPESLAPLPAPDRVFVGGSKGRLAEIIAATASLLPEDGRIVVNGLTPETINKAPGLLRQHGLAVTTATIGVSRCDEFGEETQYNPITITTGHKECART
ncbi:MAG: bifunctional cobalt-precorrin-7 (C(5))-methyltransferase/cobalt-precorrin-6B (C(15))-methyltransferase [Desulfobacterales bacterium]|nr:MAG: bifunctional cobalt-precorrin-7 (C(5))-methyltransferase/cobalt-precorrin-6B (C(15))-methyltransferase [Desulfobacterales bacterium]